MTSPASRLAQSIVDRAPAPRRTTLAPACGEHPRDHVRGEEDGEHSQYTHTSTCAPNAAGAMGRAAPAGAEAFAAEQVDPPAPTRPTPSTIERREETSTQDALGGVHQRLREPLIVDPCLPHWRMNINGCRARDGTVADMAHRCGTYHQIVESPTVCAISHDHRRETAPG